jgi:type IV pilus assembly protein PilW
MNIIVTPQKQQGLSLVELMIALLLGSFLTIGLVQIFSSNSQSFRMVEASSRAQESGRMGAEILSRALRNAGFFGCFPINGVTNNLDTTDSDYDPGLFDFQLQGISADNSLRPAGAEAGTDFFVTMGSRRAGASIAATAQVNAASFTVNDKGTLESGDIVFITDCVNGDIFELSNVQGGSGGGPVTLVANSGNGAPGNDFSANSPPGCNNPNNCLSAIYGEGSEIFQPYSEVYYIGTGASGEPGLFMRDSSGATFELVSGVVDMRLRFGEGQPATGVQDWKTPAESPNWNNVLAVQVSLLVRGSNEVMDSAMGVCFPVWDDCSAAPSWTAPDERLYRVFDFTTAIRNRISG